jgi:hypothetical protein
MIACSNRNLETDGLTAHLWPTLSHWMETNATCCFKRRGILNRSGVPLTMNTKVHPNRQQPCSRCSAPTRRFEHS